MPWSLLAQAGDLPRLAQEWARIEELGGHIDVADAQAFIETMVGLARRAREADERRMQTPQKVQALSYDLSPGPKLTSWLILSASSQLYGSATRQLAARLEVSLRGIQVAMIRLFRRAGMVCLAVASATVLTGVPTQEAFAAENISPVSTQDAWPNCTTRGSGAGYASIRIDWCGRNLPLRLWVERNVDPILGWGDDWCVPNDGKWHTYYFSAAWHYYKWDLLPGYC